MSMKRKVQGKRNLGKSSSASADDPTALAAPVKVARKKAAAKKKTAAVRKKAVRKKAASSAKKTAVTRSGSGKSPETALAASGKPVISRDQRQRMIGEAAYLISLKRPPHQGGPDSDWLHAETVIDMIFDVAD